MHCGDKCNTFAVYKLELRSSGVVSRTVVESAYIAIECGWTVVVYPPPQLREREKSLWCVRKI